MGLLSVIVPVYNMEKYLKRCVESIISQLDITDELILVDDGSSDKSVEICDHYAEKYSFIKVIHQLNGGVGNARNSGIKAANGKYIVFVDADDYVTSDMVKEVKKYTDMDLDFIMFGQNSDSHKGLSKDAIDIYIYDLCMRTQFLKIVFSGEKSDMGDYNFHLRSSVAKAFCRKFLVRNQIFFDEGVQIGEDMLFMLRVCSTFQKVGCVKNEIYFYFKNGNSITNRYKPDLQNIITSYENAIYPWLKVNSEYIPYHANYRLNDIILYIKYDFFHKENTETYFDIKKRMKIILREGNYSEYYMLSKKSGLLSLYSISKRITIWLAIHRRFFELKCIARIKYG